MTAAFGCEESKQGWRVAGCTLHAKCLRGRWDRSWVISVAALDADALSVCTKF